MRHLRARAILIHIGIMVLPVCVLVWLGLQSFQRQSEALRQLEYSPPKRSSSVASPERIAEVNVTITFVVMSLTSVALAGDAAVDQR